MKVSDLAALGPAELLEVATRLALRVKELDAARGELERQTRTLQRLLDDAGKTIADLRAEVADLADEVRQKELARQALFMRLRRGDTELHRLFGVKRLR